ncbi:unnamed protein product [Parascedosporium putredinis]|uniref:Uncharacterized protein n=1 Tax=Parascedosporium putredinis TaxID=1442378 RepID=A0A9P1H5E6_9PEZI|nr:unnamed protein product [Parascedosporium putredinis]CAI7997697.1 unnamed protein product [Parascedosporium putredinis]
MLFRVIGILSSDAYARADGCCRNMTTSGSRTLACFPIHGGYASSPVSATQSKNEMANRATRLLFLAAVLSGAIAASDSTVQSATTISANPEPPSQPPSPQNPEPSPVPNPPQQQPGGGGNPGQPAEQPSPITNDPSTGNGNVRGDNPGLSAGKDSNTPPAAYPTGGNRWPGGSSSDTDGSRNGSDKNGDNNNNNNNNNNDNTDNGDDDMNNNNTNGTNGGTSGSGFSTNRTLIITLSTVLSVIAFLIVLGTIIVCYRLKRGRLPFLARGISPIDDEEIESWKKSAAHEKYTRPPTATVTRPSSSAVSIKKPPSVIVYQNAAGGTEAPELSPRSFHTAKKSIDIPQAAVFARAPNSRPGLTDDAVEGDEAFIPTPRRHHSRLSKSHRHVRSRSRSSPRASNEYAHYYPRTSHSYDRKHSRIYSDSSNPPRSSFDDEYFMGAMSPRPLLPKPGPTPECEIGRAIG